MAPPQVNFEWLNLQVSRNTEGMSILMLTAIPRACDSGCRLGTLNWDADLELQDSKMPTWRYRTPRCLLGGTGLQDADLEVQDSKMIDSEIPSVFMQYIKNYFLRMSTFSVCKSISIWLQV